ncbi:FMN-dependent NADH-azoreductase [Xanthomonas maliensis]|uniref:FMN-dependent NADH-azoreductase n=1 Tax=Xanthomonas maliensis TaxID=1321368 RepID=UPI0003A5594E|nr:FMN-dependent NADH-azoreductase [Xanthomonas maliensis]KAB7769784.1 FMN-dependent NADH-azoreductase [Xanthomonas maliensis]
MKILHIDSSILAADSVTRELTAATVARLRTAHPAASVTYRDLVADPINHLTGAIAAGFRPTGVDHFDAATLREHAVSQTLLDEFLAHDVLVIGVPMYNFSLPSQLKAWLDRLAQVGRTFKYTETGPVGLVGGKQILLASGRGGFYAEGPLTGMDFQERYLLAFFRFLGITEVQVVRAEGASKGPAVRQAGLERAHLAIFDALAQFQAR